jgi:hypothetical protein
MSIKPENIERVTRFYTSNKWQFVYPDFFPFPADKLYKIIYTKDKKQIFVDFMGKIIMLVSNNTLFGRYKRLIRNLKREVYLKSSRILISDELRKVGIFNRYFAKYILTDEIFEIDKLQFNLDTPFYQKVKLTWIIKGTVENVKIANTIFLQEADKKLNGIRNFLDPLQFYREDISPEDELREKLGNLKFGIESKKPVKKKKKEKKKKQKKVGKTSTLSKSVDSTISSGY